MRTFHIDQKNNRVIYTDHPSVKAHLLAQGYKLATTPRAARQYASRHQSTIVEANANWVPAEVTS